MDLTSSSTQQETRQRVSGALTTYSNQVFAINFNLLRTAISQINADFEERHRALGIAPGSHDDHMEREKRLFALRKYFKGSEVETPEKIEDLQNITLADLNNPKTARRILPIVVNPPGVDPSEDLRKLQRDVEAASAADVDATLPDDFLMLATLAEMVAPPGLPQHTAELSLTFPILYAEVMPLSELKEECHMVPGPWGRGGGYNVHAGFVIDPTCPVKFPPLFAWLLCDRAATEGQRERPRGWRIVFIEYWYDPLVFESVEEFLGWFAGYEMPGVGSWDEETGSYLNK